MCGHVCVETQSQLSFANKVTHACAFWFWQHWDCIVMLYFNFILCSIQFAMKKTKIGHFINTWCRWTPQSYNFTLHKTGDDHTVHRIIFRVSWWLIQNTQREKSCMEKIKLSKAEQQKTQPCCYLSQSKKTEMQKETWWQFSKTMQDLKLSMMRVMGVEKKPSVFLCNGECGLQREYRLLVATSACRFWQLGCCLWIQVSPRFSSARRILLCENFRHPQARTRFIIK